ncbi:MAG TPA: FapA family protein [Defluviitoga sp.]|nr:FapA family protein [Defluviitoga sp.]HOP24243.1 FapA family protein [Defluviitoga sp.]HPZ28165.1 FapA family protein [Defluviitoga sp.]HQD62055.1 FapA family protein [Defluviitoga sp.]
MARYEIKISEDAMVASLKLINDGRPPTINEIEEFLREKGIVHGIMNEVIQHIISNPKYDKDYTIAYGTPPGIGEDAKIVFREIIEKEIENKETSKIDMKEVSELVIVNKGDELAEIIPPTKGEDGKNVKGGIVEGLLGKELKLRLGKNVYIENNKIISKMDGKFITTQDKSGEIYIDVLDEHKINGNVDYSTGNVRFPGKLYISGDVKAGFVVEARDYLEIKGVVESATVICEGDAYIFGVKGAGKGFVKAKNLKCNYIENSFVEVEETLIVSTSILNSTIKSGKNVIVEGKNGRIAGGSVLATKLIESDILGSVMHVRTICEVGIPPELNQELIKLENQLASDTENLKKISSILTGLRKLKEMDKLDEQRLEYYKKSLNTFKVLLEEIEKTQERIREIKSQIQDSREEAFIIARDVAYPGVEIIIHKKKFVPTKPLTKVIFQLENEEIVLHGYKAEVFKQGDY